MRQIQPLAQFCVIYSETQFSDAAADEALRRVFVRASLLPMVSVPVAVFSLQMATFIHQSQLRSTPGIPRSTSFHSVIFRSSSSSSPTFAVLLHKRTECPIVNIPSGALSAVPRARCAPAGSRLSVCLSSPPGTCCVGRCVNKLHVFPRVSPLVGGEKK